MFKLLFIILCVSASFGAPTTPTTVSAKAVVPVKKEVKTDYEKAIDAVQSKFQTEAGQIVKTRQDNVSLQEKIQKQSVVLASKEDSLYNSVKASLKAVYEKEMEKLTTQEAAIRQKEQQIETVYQEALKKIEALRTKPEVNK